VGRTTVNLAEARIVLPSIDKVLNSLEEDLFQADDHQFEVNLQHLDGLVERASSGSQPQGIDVDKVVTTLQSGRKNQLNTHWVWILVVIITSMACGAAWPIWVKLFNKCCPRIRECVTRILQSPLAPGSVKLHECETGLQVNQGEEATGVRAEVTTESAIPLTGFARHVVLAVDNE